MRRFTLPNLFLTVDGDDTRLEQIYPGLYEEKESSSPEDEDESSNSDTKKTSQNHEEHFKNELKLCEKERVGGSTPTSPAGSRRWKAPFSQVCLSERKPSKGSLLAATFGIGDDGKDISVHDLKEKGKDHATKLSPEITVPCGASPLPCPYCGGCQETCLKSLGVSPDDGSKSPTTLSPKAEKMCAFFERNLNQVTKGGAQSLSTSPKDDRHCGRRSPQRKVEEDRYPFPKGVHRSQRSHSLAAPGAIDQVARFRRLHERRPDALFVRLKKDFHDLSLSSPPSISPMRAASPLPLLANSPIDEHEEENVPN